MEQGYLVLVTATIKEMKSLLNKYFNQVPSLQVASPVEWTLNKTKFILLVTGVGPINAALEMGKLIAGTSLKGVLNFGIAGAFDTEKHPLLTTVVVKEEIWPEYGLLSETGVDVKGLGFAHGCLNGHKIWDRIELRPEEQIRNLNLFLPDHWKEGRSLTVSGVSGSPEIASQRYRTYISDFENMEGFAIAWACLREYAPFLEIRTISNQVGSLDRKDWEIGRALGALSSVFESLFG